MWERFLNEMTQATLEIVHSIARFLPRLMVMLAIVVIGWVIAYILKYTLRSILRLAHFDRLSERLTDGSKRRKESSVSI